MTINTYYPPKLFRFLSELAARHELAVKEVETIFLRKQAESMGFTCKHRNFRFAKNGRPYCKDCWTRLEKLSEDEFNRTYTTHQLRTGNYTRFKPIKTFLDSAIEPTKVPQETRLPTE